MLAIYTSMSLVTASYGKYKVQEVEQRLNLPQRAWKFVLTPEICAIHTAKASAVSASTRREFITMFLCIPSSMSSST